MLKQTLLEAVMAGGAELKRFFNGDFKISQKEGINNPVTEADHASEAAIISIIKRIFPITRYWPKKQASISRTRTING